MLGAPVGIVKRYAIYSGLSLAAAMLLVVAGCDKLAQAKKNADQGAVTAQAKAEADRKAALEAAAPVAPPPADQEISVNLNFLGKEDGGKLGFDFKAAWGDYKTTGDSLSIPASGGGRTSMDLGIAKVTIEPKLTSKTKGKYTVDLKDPSGKLIGRYDINDSGKQVNLTSTSTPGYSQKLMYFDPERRLTGFKVMRGTETKGKRPEELFGVIFVGKGWTTSETFKGVDMSKGYVFPEVDVVVLPPAWVQNNDMSRTCHTLKLGTVVDGGPRCYS
jgi:hypothetical protein